jgi:hypothetical protein
MIHLLAEDVKDSHGPLRIVLLCELRELEKVLGIFEVLNVALEKDVGTYGR